MTATVCTLGSTARTRSRGPLQLQHWSGHQHANCKCPPVGVIIDPVPADHGGGAGGGPGQQGEGGHTQQQHGELVTLCGDTGDCCLLCSVPAAEREPSQRHVGTI